MEAEEENYFNQGDDEDEAPPPIVSTPPPRGNTLKRKRTRTSIPVRTMRSSYVAAPPTPPLGGLVDYDDGDDTSGTASSGDPNAPSSPKGPLRMRQPTNYFSAVYKTGDGQSSDAHATGRQAPPSKIPTLSHGASSVPPATDVKQEGPSLADLWEGPKDLPEPGLGVKRRRDDDDDEMLERLFTKSKRPSVNEAHSEKANGDMPAAGKASPVKAPEDGPKKIKMKLGTIGAAVASSTPPTSAPSCIGTKDGDNG